MGTNITIQSFVAGLFLFVLSFISMMAKGGAVVVILTHFLPGLILGIILMTDLSSHVKNKTKLFFILLSTLIHILCAFFVNVANEQEIITSIRLLTASSTGAILLTLIFDVLITKQINFKRTVLIPFIIGLASSLLSAYCLYYLHFVDFEQNVLEALTWAGIFSIFPIWYSLFTLNIRTRKKAAANNGFAKDGLTN